MKRNQQGSLAGLLLTLLSICLLGWVAWTSLNTGKPGQATPADVANKPKQVEKEVEAIVVNGQKQMEEALKANEAGKIVLEPPKTD